MKLSQPGQARSNNALQRFNFFLLLSCSTIAFGKIYNEGDHLLPGFDVQSLEVAREYRRKNPECPEVMEKVTEYR